MSAASTSAVLRRVPSELLKEILLNLPVKSLVRFSTVSKSWLSMIFESRFVHEHKRRAAVTGVKRMATDTVSLYNYIARKISVCRIPHTSSPATDDSTHLICPIEGDLRRLHASCDGLWLVEAANFVDTENSRSLAENYTGPIELRQTKNSIYLWNPSTRTHRKLPDSLLPATGTEFGLGLGYDSVADDYKVLKIARYRSSHIPTELYSLKSDSWKTISAPPPGINRQERIEYVNGSLNWIPKFSNAIFTFDVSSEKCGEIMFPGALDSDFDWKDVEVMAMAGKLCASVNNSKFYNPEGFRFALWVMEEYGVEESWTKVLNIEHGFSPAFKCGILKPVHFYDNGDVLLSASDVGLCTYRNEGARFERLVARDGSTLRGGFSYVESLVSPLPEHVITSRHEINV